MCMFCAAVPVAAAVGVNLNNRQKLTRQVAESQGTSVPREKPIAKITVVVIALLTVASVVYHAVLSPLLRI